MAGSVMYSEGRLSTGFCRDFSQTLHFRLNVRPTLTGYGLMNKLNSYEFLGRVSMTVCIEFSLSWYGWSFTVMYSRSRKGFSIGNDSGLYSQRFLFETLADTRYQDVSHYLNENAVIFSWIGSKQLLSTLFSMRHSLTPNYSLLLSQS